jgi:hypothetical protein
MNVGQVIELVREWVDRHGRHIDGFRAAHLMGGILMLPHDAPFPAYRDVDLNIVCDGDRPTTTHDVAHNGLIIEYSLISIDKYRTPEDVLSNPELAANLKADSILADPHGILAPLHEAVAAQYADQRWIEARCAYEQQTVKQIMGGLWHVTAPTKALWLLTSGALFLSGLLAEASLRAPTHRRSLVLMREVLYAQGHADLHEAVLRLLGWAELGRKEVEQYLGDCALAFDRAVAVTRRPVMMQYKLQPHIRPYVIDGAQEMIDQGYHREAMFWIAGFLMFANAAIQADAPDHEKPLFQAKLDRLIAEMGLSTAADVAARAREAQALADALFAVADALVLRGTA